MRVLLEIRVLLEGESYQRIYSMSQELLRGLLVQKESKKKSYLKSNCDQVDGSIGSFDDSNAQLAT